MENEEGRVEEEDEEEEKVIAPSNALDRFCGCKRAEETVVELAREADIERDEEEL